MIERFKNIFYGLDRAHGVTLVGESNSDGNKIKGKSFVKREPVTDELWQKHLDGADSLGIIPINDDNKCKWGCIDIDSYAEFDHKKFSKSFYTPRRAKRHFTLKGTFSRKVVKKPKSQKISENPKIG